MKYLQRSIFLLLVLSSVHVNAQTWLWAKDSSASGSSAIDKFGNLFIAGNFNSATLTLGSYTLFNTGFYPSCDMFIAKYDSTGNIRWAKSAGISTGNDVAEAVATDTLGNVYVVGEGAITGGCQLFLRKYDSSGTLVWTNNATAMGWDCIYAYSVTVDNASGYVYICGDFPAPSVSFGATTLTSAGGLDAYLVKYDFDGNVIWARSAGGSSGEYAKAVTVDGSGNVYVTGNFYSDTFYADTSMVLNAGMEDIFIIKYDSAGNVIYVKRDGGAYQEEPRYVAVDANKNTYVYGLFYGNNITLGTTTLTNTDTTVGSADIYLAKYDSTGTFMWAKGAGGKLYDYATSLNLDAAGNIYITGNFSLPSITFGTHTLTGTSDYAMFITKYDPSGNAIWVKATDGSGDTASCGSAAMSRTGSLYVNGSFSAPGALFNTTTLTHPSGFMAKLDCTDVPVITTNVGTFKQSAGLKVYPNPVYDQLEIRELTDVTQYRLHTITGSLLDAGSMLPPQSKLSMKSYADGLYILELNTNDGNREIVKILKAGK